jgi:hypothetical protein
MLAGQKVISKYAELIPRRGRRALFDRKVGIEVGCRDPALAPVFHRVTCERGNGRKNPAAPRMMTREFIEPPGIECRQAKPRVIGMKVVGMFLFGA